MSRAYTVASLAREWDCSEGSIRKLIADGRLDHFRIGTLIRIPVDEARRFECQITPSSASEAATRSSIETQQDGDTESGFTRPTVLGLKRKHGADGPQGATILHGRWGE